MKTRSSRTGVAIGFGVIVVSITVAWWQREVGMQRGIDVIGSPGAAADPQALSAAIDHALYAIVGGIVGVLVGIAVIVRAVILARRRCRLWFCGASMGRTRLECSAPAFPPSQAWKLARQSLALRAFGGGS